MWARLLRAIRLRKETSDPTLWDVVRFDFRADWYVTAEPTEMMTLTKTEALIVHRLRVLKERSNTKTV